MSDLVRDLKFARRSFLETASLTALVVLILGIAANTAIFSIVNTVVLQPLPYEDSERIVRIWEEFRLSDPEQRFHLSEVELVDLRQGTRSFEDIAGYTVSQSTLLTEGRAQEIPVVRVSPNLFSILGVDAAQGRVFLPEEEEPGRSKVVLMSSASANRRFGGKEALGRELLLDGEAHEIVGILPEGFQFPVPTGGGSVELWIPEPIDLANLPAERWGADGRYLDVVARLAPGASLEQSQSDLDALARVFQERYPDAYRADAGFGFGVVPLLESEVGSLRPTLWILFGAGTLVLLITAVNVGSLLMTRVQKRSRELALRTALGASPFRMLRQMLTESFFLTGLGGFLGLVCGILALRIFLKVVPPGIPRISEVGFDVWVFAFTALIAALAGVLAGLVPLRPLRKMALSEELKAGGRSTGGNRWLRGGLVAAEIAIALVVLVAAALLIKNFVGLLEIDPGFRSDRVLTADIVLPAAEYTTPEQLISLHDRLIEEVESLSGVERAAIVSYLPLSGQSSSWGVSFEGHPVGPEDSLHEVDFGPTSPGYFDVMRIPFVEGRTFSDDLTPDGPREVIIDERLAETYWPGESAIGKHLKRGRTEDLRPSRPWIEIVGVVKHVRHKGVTDTTERDRVYYPHHQSFRLNVTLVVLAAFEDPLALAGPIRAKLTEIDPQVPLANVKVMEDWVDASLVRPRFAMLLLTAFGIIALLLVLSGTYGVVSSSTAERMKELSLRMALGAQRSRVVFMVIAQGLLLGAIGIAAGLVVTLFSTRILASQLYGVSTTDLGTFILVPLVLLAVLAAACFVPAWRAATADPAQVLRAD